MYCASARLTTPPFLATVTISMIFSLVKCNTVEGDRLGNSKQPPESECVRKQRCKTACILHGTYMCIRPGEVTLFVTYTMDYRAQGSG